MIDTTGVWDPDLFLIGARLEEERYYGEVWRFVRIESRVPKNKTEQLTVDYTNAIIRSMMGGAK